MLAPHTFHITSRVFAQNDWDRWMTQYGLLWFDRYENQSPVVHAEKGEKRKRRTKREDWDGKGEGRVVKENERKKERKKEREDCFSILCIPDPFFDDCGYSRILSYSSPISTSLLPCPPDALLLQPADFFLPPLHSLKRCSRLCLPFCTARAGPARSTPISL